MEKTTTQEGVQLLELTGPLQHDVALPANQLYLMQCLAQPKPETDRPATTVYALVSLSSEEVLEIKQKRNTNTPCDLYALETLYLKPEQPLTEKEYQDILLARRLLRYQP